MEKKVWRSVPNLMNASGNQVLDGDGFYISFVACTRSVIGMFDGDDGGAETALVKNGKFYILNGDWREQYEGAVNDGFDACFAIYTTHKDTNKSSWSNEAPSTTPTY
jgi:hypothetical protein